MIPLPPRRPIWRVDEAEIAPERRDGANETGIKALAEDARKAKARLTRSIVGRGQVTKGFPLL